MSRLSKRDQQALIRIGENMQPNENPLGIPVGMKTMPPDAVGDINSDAKGSGARYNAGKPPMELLPVRLLAEYYRRTMPDPMYEQAVAIDALFALASWQEHCATSDNAALYDVLRILGETGWDECARVFNYGRAKYAEWNWAKGMAWSVPFACAVRHLRAIIRGELIDSESGLPHRGHVFCNIVMLLTFEHTYVIGDNRPPKDFL